MNARRRYDTTALIQDLKTDRRKGIGLTLAAVVIILVLVGVYFTQMGGGTPEVPESASPIAQSEAQKKAALDAAIEKPAQPVAEPAPEPAPPANASFEISLPRKGQLWIDDESVGKVKSHAGEIAPGEHTFKAKIGRRTIEQKETLAPGSKVQLMVNPKKRKFLVTVLEAGIPDEGAPLEPGGEEAAPDAEGG